MRDLLYGRSLFFPFGKMKLYRANFLQSEVLLFGISERGLAFWKWASSFHPKNPSSLMLPFDRRGGKSFAF